MKKHKLPIGILAIKGNFSQKQLDVLGKIWDNIQKGKKIESLPVVQLSEHGSIEFIELPGYKIKKNKKNKKKNKD